MEKLIKQKLIERGFTEETLLNNRGLIGAVIDETKEQLRIGGVSKSVCIHQFVSIEGKLNGKGLIQCCKCKIKLQTVC